MFGLMKISTHEAKLADAHAAQRIKHEALQTCKTRASTAEAEIVTLKGQLENMTVDRDNWKQSESACNTRYDKLQAENVTLKARIAELEKPATVAMRKTFGKASPVTATVKVPVKGKVK